MTGIYLMRSFDQFESVILALFFFPFLSFQCPFLEFCASALYKMTTRRTLGLHILFQQ